MPSGAPGSHSQTGCPEAASTASPAVVPNAEVARVEPCREQGSDADRTDLTSREQRLLQTVVEMTTHAVSRAVAGMFADAFAHLANRERMERMLDLHIRNELSALFNHTNDGKEGGDDLSGSESVPAA